MKMTVFFFGVFIFCAGAFAQTPLSSHLDWNVLSPSDDVTLDQALLLRDSRGANVVVESGSAYRVREVIGLEIPAVLYTFEAEKCAHPGVTTEMELILPEEGTSQAEVGVTYGPNCDLSIYVETKDLLTPSFFLQK
ncbi:MAG: hypothetical protein H7301_09345 [Cryobacterium sp.]|nr:hypothetical protein [Oligoflexia bacterium]